MTGNSEMLIKISKGPGKKVMVTEGGSWTGNRSRLDTLESLGVSFGTSSVAQHGNQRHCSCDRLKCHDPCCVGHWKSQTSELPLLLRAGQVSPAGGGGLTTVTSGSSRMELELLRVTSDHHLQQQQVSVEENGPRKRRGQDEGGRWAAGHQNFSLSSGGHLHTGLHKKSSLSLAT